jgi:hypothetical protein
MTEADQEIVRRAYVGSLDTMNKIAWAALAAVEMEWQREMIRREYLEEWNPGPVGRPPFRIPMRTMPQEST